VSGERAQLIDGIRRALRALRAEGLDWIGPRAAPRAQAPPTAARAAHAAGFRPRVAALELPGAEQLGERAQARAAQLLEVRSDLGECTRCGLSETRRTIVFGEGNPDAPVVFVGEGPGEEEDRSGRPFVGRAGELLTKIIASVGWRREDVYICNIVKCRPPGNRDPRLEEIAMCQPFLERQLRAIEPVAIVTLGKPATSTLLGRPVSITRLRGKWLEWSGFPLMPTFHPAYLLRNYTRETRQAVWDDLKAVRARVEAAGR
jgi:DNA polymerase